MRRTPRVVIANTFYSPSGYSKNVMIIQRTAVNLCAQMAANFGGVVRFSLRSFLFTKESEGSALRKPIFPVQKSKKSAGAEIQKK